MLGAFFGKIPLHLPIQGKHAASLRWDLSETCLQSQLGTAAGLRLLFPLFRQKAPSPPPRCLPLAGPSVGLGSCGTGCEGFRCALSSASPPSVPRWASARGKLGRWCPPAAQRCAAARGLLGSPLGWAGGGCPLGPPQPGRLWGVHSPCPGVGSEGTKGWGGPGGAGQGWAPWGGLRSELKHRPPPPLQLGPRAGDSVSLSCPSWEGLGPRQLSCLCSTPPLPGSLALAHPSPASPILPWPLCGMVLGWVGSSGPALRVPWGPCGQERMDEWLGCADRHFVGSEEPS